MTSELTRLSARFLAERDRLFAYIMALVRSRTVAEDIFQDVYMTFARTIETHTVIDDLPSWCRGVARNLALRYWREQKRSERLPETHLLDSIDRAFAEEDDDDELLMAALAQCRDELGHAALSILDLKYVHDLSMRTIADKTQRSERAVITAIAHIRRRLMDCITTRLASTFHE
jgi:RNA polymerase sigma-70 factor (ECF subfamily)